MEDTQLKKGILPLCVLSSLMDHDCYGYEITAEISKELSVKCATVYLILNRFIEAGYVSSYYVEQDKRPARKYYKITKKGIDYQKVLSTEWRQFVRSVNKLIE